MFFKSKWIAPVSGGEYFSYSSVVTDKPSLSVLVMVFFSVYMNPRALRTLAQAASGAIGSALMIHEVNWIAVASTAALAAVLSILTSVATGLPEIDNKEGKKE